MRRLAEFLRDHLLDNGTYKIVALFITLSLWVVIMERKEQTLLKEVEIQFVIPNDLVPLRKPSSRVQFKVRGPRMAVKKFADSNESITVDLSGADAGRTVVRIYEDLLQLPNGVRVLGVSPSRVSLDLDRLQTRVVPVRADLSVNLEKELSIRVNIEPKQIEIHGAESVLRQLSELRTENLDSKIQTWLQDGTESTKRVNLIIPDLPGLAPVNTKSVEITIQKGRK